MKKFHCHPKYLQISDFDFGGCRVEKDERKFQNLPEEVEGMDLETEEIPVGPPIDQSIEQSKIDTDFGPPKSCSIYFMIRFLFIH